MELVAPLDLADGDIIRLDIAMRNAGLFLQIFQHFQQVFAETLQEIDMKPAFVPEPIAQRLDPAIFLIGEGRRHQEREPVADLQGAALFDNMVMTQLLEDFRFVAQPLVVRRIVRRLQHEFIAVPFDNEHDGTAAATEPPHDPIVSGQQIVLFRMIRIIDELPLVIGGRQFLFDSFQNLQEIICRVDPRADIRMRAPVNELLEVFARAVEDGADLQPPPFRAVDC